MAALSTRCPKCNSAMEEGWIVDNAYGGRTVSGWAPGKPQKSFWVGTRLRGKKPIDITACRCSSCGYVELYAR